MTIRCRPKAKVFRLFLGLEVLLLISMIWAVAKLQALPGWGYIALLVVLLLFFLLLLVKIVTGQRELRVTEKAFTETYRFFDRERRFPFKALQAWEEIRIRTGKAHQYRQLQLYFPEEYTIKLSSEEFEGYDELYQFLKGRANKKEKKTT